MKKPTRKANSPQTRSKSTIADKLWLWGHDAGAHNDSWGLPRRSRITPVEAAFYLGIPNLIMVRYLGRPPLPFDQFALSFRPLKRVVWSVVGAGGQTDDKEREHVLDLAARQANITGVMLDDFFGSEQSSPVPGSEGKGAGAALPADKLRALRGQLSLGGRRLRLWAVLYEHQLDKPLASYLKFLDVVNFWTWNSEKLSDLDSNLDRLDAVADKCGKVLGCYLWDYGKKKPMPLKLLRHQCELGLQWLRGGRIEGMVFLASCICDLELEAVEWLRDWIARTGSKRI
jgi:hypothetical protein